MLTEMQDKLYRLMARQGGGDVLIRDMYYKLYGVPSGPLVTVRDMQQKLAPIIARVNGKMTNTEIVPGRLKQTYRLAAKSQEA